MKPKGKKTEEGWNDMPFVFSLGINFNWISAKIGNSLKIKKRMRFSTHPLFIVEK